MSYEDIMILTILQKIKKEEIISLFALIFFTYFPESQTQKIFLFIQIKNVDIKFSEHYTFLE
jgi:hypothetical protein